LTQPVTSLRVLGCHASRAEVTMSVARAFGRVFDRNMYGAKMEKAEMESE
jgi:hypothetical protein